MKLNNRWMLALLCLACLPLAACGQIQSVAASDPKPITIAHLGNATEPTRETLTQKSVDRLGLQTATVSTMTIDGKERLVVPYAAIVYDTQGNTWTYVNPAPLTFVRHLVKVDRIEGDTVILADGLSAGTAVVTTGIEELYGAEFEFQEE
jgi:hypothetical protein